MPDLPGPAALLPGIAAVRSQLLRRLLVTPLCGPPAGNKPPVPPPNRVLPVAFAHAQVKPRPPSASCFEADATPICRRSCISHRLLMLLIRVGVTLTCHALQGGLALTCPLRCAPPKQVVANQTMRQLVARHFPQHRHAASRQPAEPRADPGDPAAAGLRSVCNAQQAVHRRPRPEHGQRVAQPGRSCPGRPLTAPALRGAAFPPDVRTVIPWYPAGGCCGCQSAAIATSAQLSSPVAACPCTGDVMTETSAGVQQLSIAMSFAWQTSCRVQIQQGSV